MDRIPDFQSGDGGSIPLAATKEVKRSITLGKYSNLTSKEKYVILKLADAAQNKDSWQWRTPKPGGKPILIAVDGKSDPILDVPIGDAFYVGLRDKGFISAGTFNRYVRTKFWTQQLALDYRKYDEKTDFGRLLEDMSYCLVHELTVPAKLFWLVIGGVSVYIFTILLK